MVKPPQFDAKKKYPLILEIHGGPYANYGSRFSAEMQLYAAAGYVVHLFPTGQGNVIGNPILPVIKLCANPRTVKLMSEHVDVDVSGCCARR